MRIGGLQTFGLSLALAVSTAGVACAQVFNGTFATPAESLNAGWGTDATMAGGFGPNANVVWTLGQQYAYDPSSGDFGWTFNGGAGVQQNGSAWGFTNPPNVGENAVGQTAFLQDYNGTYCYNGGCVPVGTASSPSSISQTLNTLTPGTQYDLSFYLEERGYNVGGYAPVVVIGSGSTTPQIAPNSTYVWQQYNVIFTASSTSEEIGFYSPFPSGLPSGSDLDTGIADVSLSTTLAAPGPYTYSVPEGGAAWIYLLLAGAVSCGAVLSNSRKRIHSRS